MSAKDMERPLFIDMDFDEALRRYIQTKPEEVPPPPGRKRKGARPEPKPKASAPKKQD